MMIAPCKDCKDRCIQPNCHTTCQKYLDFVKQNKENRQKEQEFKNRFKPRAVTLKYCKGYME